jgi:hypothetical protein
MYTDFLITTFILQMYTDFLITTFIVQMYTDFLITTFIVQMYTDFLITTFIYCRGNSITGLVETSSSFYNPTHVFFLIFTGTA